MGSMGVYCEMTGDKYWSDETEFTKLKGQRYNISNDVWSTTGEAVTWGFDSLSDKYTFFAYSPFYDDNNGITPRIAEGELIIDYTVPTSSLYQPDLLFATPRKDIYPQGSGCVSLSFNHVLSCVSFGVISTTDDKITAIEISGVAGSGSLNWDYTTNLPHWEPGSVSESFSVDVENYTLDDDNSAQLNTDLGYLMMIPQVLTSSVKVTLTLNNDDQQQEILMLPSNSEWVAGLTYHYTINLGDNGECDFIYDSTELSNCYIINPTEGEATVVQIPIEDRINDFWMNYSGSGTLKIYANSKTKNFFVSTIWEDFDETLKYSYEVIFDSDDKMAVILTFDAKYQEGNLLFAVEKIDGEDSDILWSWHLWFTDYNPDAIADANRASIEAGIGRKYTYGDYPGAVHRYADAEGIAESDAVWGGMYQDKFIMDRNIGERDTFASEYGAGSVFYEFGRKDPFPGKGAIYYDGDDYPSVRTSSCYSFIESVELPYDYFAPTTSASDNWSTEPDARSALYIWNDSNILASNYFEGKSIFDPSPLGWRVPVSATWNNFKSSADCANKRPVGNYYYYGYRDGENVATLTGYDSQGYVWSANKSGVDEAYCFGYSETEVNPKDELVVMYGLPIRAIEE